MSEKEQPNLFAIRTVATALGPLLGELVLVGGCAVGLLVSDKARPPVRHTIDVDLLAEITSKWHYAQLGEQLRQLGFREAGDYICRWKKNGIVVDIMPQDPSILGFTNTWYADTIKHAISTALQDGTQIRHAAPPYFLATKLESFNGRGKGDFSHHDLEDVITLVDGRAELLAEVDNADPHVRSFIQDEMDELLATTAFIETVPWHLGPSEVEQARVELVIERMRSLAGL